jgi:hypothetical protein
MKHTVLAATVGLAFSTGLAAAEAETDPLEDLGWLVGNWVGVGEGEPGRSASERRVACVLACRYLRFDGRSVYPRQDKNPKGETHLQIDMWSFDRRRQKLVLRTFDNLGFVTTYVQDDAGGAQGKLVLVAEHLENVPAGWKARYTYTFVPPDEYRELFELDPNGKGYQPYTSNRFLRVAAPDPR